MKNQSLYLKLSAVCLSMSMLSACGGGSSNPGTSAAYQEDSKYCSSEFVSETNAMGSVQVNSRDRGSIDRANAAIDSYISKYRNVKCTAKQNGVTTDVDANQVAASARKTVADFKAQYFPEASAPTPAPVVVVTPPVTSVPVTPPTSPVTVIDMSAPVQAGVVLKISDADTVNRLAVADGNLVIQNGTVLAPTSITSNANGNVCFIQKGDGAAAVNNGDVITFSSVYVRDQGSKLVLVSQKIVVGCIRMGTVGTWSAKELQDVLKGVISVTPNK